MPKGLLFGVPSVSVSNTIGPLVGELDGAGYEIVCYSAGALAPAGHDAVRFKAYPTCYDPGRMARQIPYFDFVEMLLDTALGLQDFLRQEVEAERPDFILHSHMAPWGKALAAGYGLPAVSLYSTFVLDPRIMLPFFRKQRQEGSDVKGDLRQFLRCQRKYKALYAQFPARCPAPDIWDAYVNKEGLNIVFVHKDLQEQSEIFGPEFQFVGHPTRAMPHDGERRLVYLSLSTIIADLELLNLSARAFGRLARPCLISLGKKLKPEALAPLPANVTVAPFVDQEDVLGAAAVFVTKGGMAGVHEAIAAETPMVVIPELPEQHITARKLEELGIATRLDRRDLTEDCLLAAIAQVLRDSRTYRNNIRAIKRRHRCGDQAKLARAHIVAYLNGGRPQTGERPAAVVNEGGNQGAPAPYPQ